MAATTIGVLTAVAIAAAAGGSAYSAKTQADNGRDARRAAEDAANKQKRDADALAAAADSRRANEEGTAAATQTADAARKRQRAIAAGGAGARSNILTGPLGVMDNAPVARKNILGA